jgi:hypothetical protein
LDILTCRNAVKDQRVIESLKYRAPALTGLALVGVLTVLTLFHETRPFLLPILPMERATPVPLDFLEE